MSTKKIIGSLVVLVIAIDLAALLIYYTLPQALPVNELSIFGAIMGLPTGLVLFLAQRYINRAIYYWRVHRRIAKHTKEVYY